MHNKRSRSTWLGRPLWMLSVAGWVLACCFTAAAQLDTSSSSRLGEGEKNKPTASSCKDFVLVSKDLDHFWAAWDIWQTRDGGDPKALPGLLQTMYIDKGTPGLQAFIPDRIESANHLADTILKDVEVYRQARPIAAPLLTQAAALKSVCDSMRLIYPEAKMPPVYLVIGARNSGGTSKEAGLILGLEMRAHDASPEEFVATVAHELVHFQQTIPTTNTLLRQSMMEGAADFIAERIAGSGMNERSKTYADAHEQELWEAFSRQMHGPQTGDWLYNMNTIKNGVPPDLGYYEGYKVCQAFLQTTRDKAYALRTILVMADDERILRESRYSDRFR